MFKKQKAPQFLKNQLLKKAQKQGIKETHESGALKTLGWILIVIGFLFCLLGLLFILVGK